MAKEACLAAEKTDIAILKRKAKHAKTTLSTFNDLDNLLPIFKDIDNLNLN